MIEELCANKDSSWLAAAIFVWQLIEYWLGRTNKVKAGSTLELLKNLIFKKNIITQGVKMELAKGLTLDYKGGKAVLEVDVAGQVNSKLDELIAKVESGEIDLVKGTDFEKGPVMIALQFIKSELNK